MMGAFKTWEIKERRKGNTGFKDKESNTIAFTCPESQSKQLLKPRIEMWGS